MDHWIKKFFGKTGVPLRCNDYSSNSDTLIKVRLIKKIIYFMHLQLPVFEGVNIYNRNAYFFEGENTEKHFCICIHQVDEVRGSITVKSPNAGHGEPPKTFTFDNVFGMKSKQVDVYNQVARPIVDFVLEGYNGRYRGTCMMNRIE